MRKLRIDFPFKNKQFGQAALEIPKALKVTDHTDSKTTVITIYGIIGDAYEGITENQIDEILNNTQAENIVLRINSPGGDAMAGIAIYNRLKEFKGNVKSIVDGYCCSSASTFALAGDLEIREGALFMIHNPWGFAVGDYDELEKSAEMLRKMRDSYAEIYASNSELTKEEAIALMNEETWFTAEEAITVGFAKEFDSTSIVLEEPVASFVINKNSVLARFSDPKPKQNILAKLQRA